MRSPVLAPLCALVTLTLLGAGGCSSDDGAARPDAPAAASETAAPRPAGPPPGIGRTDDGAVLGPFGAGGPLTVQAWKSTEAGGTVNSWLLLGEHDAALIDAQLVVSQGREVVKMIQASGKTLKWVWVTHGHPDHSTGLGVIHEAFPEARLLAHPRVAEAAPALFAKYQGPLNKFFPGDIPDAATPLEAHPGDTLELEGSTLRILTFEEGETEFTTALHVPTMKALFCADLVYHHVHPWLNEMKVEGVLAHVAQLEAMDDVDTLYPGHGEPMGKDYLATYRSYVDFFLSQVPLAKDGPDLIQRVWERYPDWRTMAGLRFSAAAHIKARGEAAP